MCESVVTCEFIKGFLSFLVYKMIFISRSIKFTESDNELSKESTESPIDDETVEATTSDISDQETTQESTETTVNIEFDKTTVNTEVEETTVDTAEQTTEKMLSRKKRDSELLINRGVSFNL